MRRLIFITTLTVWSMGQDKGGPAFSQTIKKYVSEGWEVSLLSDEPSNAKYPHLDQAHNIVIKPTLFKKHSHMRKVGLLFRWLDHLFMTCVFCQKAEQLLSSGCDDTILYGYEVFGVKACRKLAHKFSIPFVTRFQGTILSQYRNTVINRIRNYPQYQALSHQADLVIMTDDGTQGDRILRDLHNSGPSVLFLRNGLDLMEREIQSMKDAFDRSAFRAKLGIAQKDTLFLTVSRLTRWKRVERTIDGFAESLKVSSDSKLVIVGDGDMRAELEKRVIKLNIVDQVIFAGAIAHDAVYDYMMASDVFVSLYDLSNVGNPLLEAMALGKCIITLDVGDTKKLIENRKNGILMTYEMLPQLGSIMSELAVHREEREALGMEASAYAQENFYSWEKRMDIEYDAVSGLL